MEDGDEIEGEVKRFGKVIRVGLRVDFEVKICGKVILLVETVDVFPVCKLVVEDSVRSRLNGDVVVEGVVCFNDSVEVDNIITVVASLGMSVLLSAVDVFPVCKLFVEDSVSSMLNGDVVVNRVVGKDSVVV